MTQVCDPIERLRQALSRGGRRTIDRPERAAVLVTLMDDGGPVRLLLTRRTDDLPTHRGQVAFPGGYMRPGEADPVTTALREAEEEVGLPPDRVEVLGLLGDLPTHTDLVAVTPVVGCVRDLPPLSPRTGEVARIFFIALDDLARADRWAERDMGAGGASRRFPVFDHDGETLWGLSARIVNRLLSLLPGPSG